MGSIIQYLLEAAVTLVSLLVYWLVRLFAVSTDHSFLDVPVSTPEHQGDRARRTG